MELRTILPYHHRVRFVGLFLLGAIVIAIPLSIYIGQSNQNQRPRSHAVSIGAPTDGYGVYESCLPSQGTPCLERLKQIAQGGFKLVLNYDSVAGSAAQLLRYADQAHAVALKLIWAIDAPRFWNGLTDLRSFYPALSATCNCDDNAGFIRYFLNLVKNHPATWGYYIGDETDPNEHAQLKAFADLVHQTDPTHPRLFISCGACAKYTHTQPRYVASLIPMVDTADVIGSDYYPVGADGRPLENTGEVANAVQSVADHFGKQSAMVLQAFSFTQYNGYLECSPYPGCATFPSYDQMKLMLDLTLQNAHPRLILWYSYFDLVKYSNPLQHWADLVAVAGASSGPDADYQPLIAYIPCIDSAVLEGDRPFTVGHKFRGDAVVSCNPKGHKNPTCLPPSQSDGSQIGQTH